MVIPVEPGQGGRAGPQGPRTRRVPTAWEVVVGKCAPDFSSCPGKQYGSRP